jgi:hypothetical protein
MRKSMVILVAACIFLALFTAPATASDVNGAWYMGGPLNAGQACRIEQKGDALTFINERGDRSPGHVKDGNAVIATGWGNLQGTLAEESTRINWANGTWWSRFPLLQGTWTIGGRPCRIEQKGRELTFINERGERAAGHFKDASTVVATGWGTLQGSLAEGNRRINWANNTSWSR